MPSGKVAISIEPALLTRIDAEAAGAGQSRSAFIAEALRQALEQREAERVLRAARTCYAEIDADDELRDLHERAEVVMQETLPVYTPGSDNLAQVRNQKAVA